MFVVLEKADSKWFIRDYFDYVTLLDICELDCKWDVIDYCRIRGWNVIEAYGG